MHTTRLLAIMQGLLVTLIWSSSYVFSKYGLGYVGPFTIMGLQYLIAFAVLAPLIAQRGATLRRLPKPIWHRLLLMGVFAYPIGNGAMVWGLQYVPAATGAIMMSLSPLLVLVGGTLWLHEKPSAMQTLGAVVVVGGSLLFFSPGAQAAGEPIGLLAVTAAVFGYMLFSLLGRGIARAGDADTLTLTAVPILIGGVVLLILAMLFEDFPPTTWQGWAVIVWLALVDTALAYILYYRALKTLTALEINVLISLAPLGTAIFGWLLLNEALFFVQIGGMLLILLGVFVVQQSGAHELPESQAT
ncbi:MAG: DMT family transporter [Anaerolineales bacterium]